MHYFQRWWQVRSLFGVTKDSFCSCLFTLYIRELIFILPLFLYSAHTSSADAPHLDITIHIKRTLIVHRLTTDNNCFFFRLKHCKHAFNIQHTSRRTTKSQCDNFAKQKWNSWTKWGLIRWLVLWHWAQCQWTPGDTFYLTSHLTSILCKCYTCDTKFETVISNWESHYGTDLAH